MTASNELKTLVTQSLAEAHTSGMREGLKRSHQLATAVHMALETWGPSEEIPSTLVVALNSLQEAYDTYQKQFEDKQLKLFKDQS